MLNLMGVKSQYIEVRTKDQLLALLVTVPESVTIVHVTTHGMKRRKDFCGFWTPTGPVMLRDIRDAQVALGGKIVISTACHSGTTEFAKGLLKTTCCDHYLAPKKSPYFHDAILFAHVFYHKYLILGQSVRKAFCQYARGYHNPHQFRLDGCYHVRRK